MGLLDFLKSKKDSIPSPEKPPEGKINSSGDKISRYSKIIEELRVLVNGRGHKDFFCLDSIYSPGSRMPAVDFSFWVKDKMKNSDREALKILLWELVKGNPGLAISTGGDEEAVSDFFKGDWQGNIDGILEADISRYVMADPEVFDEIRAFMFFATIHNGLDGFVMTTSFPSLLALVLILLR